MNKERFSRLPIPVHKANVSDLKSLYEAFPGLKRYFNSIPPGVKNLKDLPRSRTYQLVDPKEQARVIKYIFFMYDPESDLINEFPDDISLRKDAAAKEAGWKRDTHGNWPDHVKDILEFRDPQVVDWILDFLKARKNYIWSDIVFIEEEIDLINRNRAEAIKTGKIDAALLKLSEERVEKRSTLYKKFWADTGDLKQHGERKLYPVTPENVFSEMLIPAEVYQIRQINDVPESARP